MKPFMSLLYLKVFGKLELSKFYIYKIIDTKLESFNIFSSTIPQIYYALKKYKSIKFGSSNLHLDLFICDSNFHGLVFFQ